MTASRTPMEKNNPNCYPDKERCPYASPGGAVVVLGPALPVLAGSDPMELQEGTPIGGGWT